ncbi:MAG: DNA methyltransferase, partial [Burkholderiales bacterium]
MNVDQFHGIEIEEFPAQIAQVAMWLVDHQMNQAISDEFGHYYARLPLTISAHIVHGNALRMEWNDVVPSERLTYMLGNPPFVGSKFLDEAQRDDAARVFAGIKDGGVLDFVAAWYVKATPYIHGTSIRCAFVSTNSITQGEQVGALWTWLLGQGVKIHFAHRTFRWSNEAAGVAAVHCVIVGFAMAEPEKRTIYDYDDPKGEPHALVVGNINPYLVDAADVVLSRRDHPICPVPEIGIGNKPIDDGNFLFSAEEKDEFLKVEPTAARFFKRFWGADDFL